MWSVAARTSVLPSSPAEKNGVVYSTTGTGLVMAFDAKDGRKLWEYQVTPKLYVFSDPVPVEGKVYMTGMDGSVTALRVTSKTGSSASEDKRSPTDCES